MLPFGNKKRHGDIRHNGLRQEAVQQEGGGWNLMVGESWRLSHHSNLLCSASVCRGAGAVRQHRRCWEVQYEALNPVELGEEAHQNVCRILYQSYVNTLPLLYYFSNFLAISLL